MEAELTFSLVVDGKPPVERSFKGEEGGDQDFIDWMQEAREKLSSWMQKQIDKECKL